MCIVYKLFFLYYYNLTNKTRNNDIISQLNIILNYFFQFCNYDDNYCVHKLFL